MSDDSDADSDVKITRAKRASKEQLRELRSLPPKEFFPPFLRLIMLPENPSRKVYSVLRDIFIAIADDWWNTLATGPKNNTRASLKEELGRVVKLQEKLQEIELWLHPAYEPISLEAAVKLAGPQPGPLGRKILEQAGKRRRPGQPASKRYLAVQALDLKCAYPWMSQSEATEILCPCGKEPHPPQCREQLRQQIIRLVNFLREHGHDFGWERIKAAKGCKESE